MTREEKVFDDSRFHCSKFVPLREESIKINLKFSFIEAKPEDELGAGSFVPALVCFRKLD